MGATMTIPGPAATLGSPAYIPLEKRGPQNSWAPVRRSGRLTLDFAIEVYGRDRNSRIFREETRTLVVSAYGGLISLAADVELGQVIVLVCKHREEMRCRVVHREEMAHGKICVGVAFLTYAPRFWGVSFPTESHSNPSGLTPKCCRPFA